MPPVCASAHFSMPSVNPSTRLAFPPQSVTYFTSSANILARSFSSRRFCASRLASSANILECSLSSRRFCASSVFKSNSSHLVTASLIFLFSSSSFLRRLASRAAAAADAAAAAAAAAAVASSASLGCLGGGCLGGGCLGGGGLAVNGLAVNGLGSFVSLGGGAISHASMPGALRLPIVLPMPSPPWRCGS
eukprot:jgi/Chrpa1/8902/Chrysochromulina_OHIO_Genome00017374-RA